MADYVSQTEFWNGPAAQRWVGQQVRLDRVYAPLLALAIERAAVRAGERVVDVGCGCGASVLELAARVGARGAVLGVDVSAPMLARARERAGSLPGVELCLADAASHAFTPDHDLLFSRFGVMFFDQPTEAFANLRRALRAGGRLCVVCWRSPELNPWYTVPLRAAQAVLPPVPQPAPGAPGPFAFADADKLRAILEGAGFADVALEAVDVELTTSDSGLDEALEFATVAGPVSRLLLEAKDDPDAVARARAAIEAAIQPFVHGQRVSFPSATWIATARTTGH